MTIPVAKESLSHFEIKMFIWVAELFLAFSKAEVWTTEKTWGFEKSLEEKYCHVCSAVIL
jgi:hypothetical protein